MTSPPELDWKQRQIRDEWRLLSNPNISLEYERSSKTYQLYHTQGGVAEYYYRGMGKRRTLVVAGLSVDISRDKAIADELMDAIENVAKGRFCNSVYIMCDSPQEEKDLYEYYVNQRGFSPVSGEPMVMKSLQEAELAKAA